MKIRTQVALGLAFTSVSALIGCATEAPTIEPPLEAQSQTEADAAVQAALDAGVSRMVISPQARLVAEVTTDDGEEIYFLEGDAGITAASIQQVGLDSALRANARGKAPVDLFAELAPGQAVPQALVAAQARMEQLGGNLKGVRRSVDATIPEAPDANDGKVVSERTGDTRTVSQSAVDDSLCPGTWFQQNICNTEADGVKICRLWRTNTNTIYDEDYGFVYTNACSYRGTISHRLRYRTWGSWANAGETTLAAGFYSSIYYWEVGFDFDLESKVFNSDGDGFHHAAVYN